jgi:hypothetical protein
MEKGGEVADHEHFGVSGNAQVRLDGHAPRPVKGDSERAGDGSFRAMSVFVCSVGAQ